MAKKIRAYDDAAYRARYSTMINISAVAASIPAGKFIAFAACKIKSLKAAVNIAGTNAAAGYDIYNGTTSIGEFVCGTSTAGSLITEVLPTAITGAMAEDTILDFRTKANSATLAATISVEYEITPVANITY
jgi:hypothetical protein